jgi:hypothetical protein
MTPTQIRLPDELHRRAKAFAAEHEISFAEVARRGIELFLARYPTSVIPPGEWKLPSVDAGGIQVPLQRLREIAADEESTRSPKSGTGRIH